MKKIPFALLLVVAIITIPFALQKDEDKIVYDNTPFITDTPFEFDECVQEKNSSVSATFPKQCKANDEKIYIEKITEPVNTNGWKLFRSDLGFSFLCPPSWKCQSFNENSVTIRQDHYLNISSFQLHKITQENFQQSLLRHPKYKTPVAWLKDLEAKKDIAVKALPETIKPVLGTDALNYPLYVNFTLDQIRIFETKRAEAVVVSGEKEDETSVIIPLNNIDVVLVTLFPGYLSDDPIIKAIISSIGP